MRHISSLLEKALIANFGISADGYESVIEHEFGREIAPGLESVKISAQKEFQITENITLRPDFFLESSTGHKAVFECDGEKFHTGAAHKEYDEVRDAVLLLSEKTPLIIRATGALINSEPEAIQEVIRCAMKGMRPRHIIDKWPDSTMDRNEYEKWTRIYEGISYRDAQWLDGRGCVVKAMWIIKKSKGNFKEALQEYHDFIFA